MEDILAGLNESQREAVTETEGYIRVIAGAGSGKTRALTRRFAFLVNELGILPGHILCVTFTNKAANEMRERIHQLTGDNDTGYINTFHGFCVSVLQEDSHAIQYPKEFLVLDNGDIDAMLQIIYEERGLTLRNMSFSKARDMIEMKKTVEIPDYYEDLIALSPEALRQKYMDARKAEDIIFYGYLYQEKKCFGVDYNDLIMLTLAIFRQQKDICLKWQERLEYIMIDEFQDIDPLQYKLMEVLAEYHKNLFIVGDPDQTIYTWRGAKAAYILEFDKAFPDVKTIFMNTNYRSTPEILAAANTLISKNKDRMDKNLTAVKPSGAGVAACHGRSGEDEAAWITKTMASLHESGAPWSSMAVLYRAHYVTRTIEDALLKAEIPYTIYSGIPFFGRKEIKDALSYLRLIAYKDDLSFARIVNTPKRNIGERRMAFLQKKTEEEQIPLYDALKKYRDDDIFKRTRAEDFISLVESYAGIWEQKPVSEILTDILHKSGYEAMLRTEGAQDRLDNLAELKQSVYEYETACGEEATLPHYLAHAALFTNSDTASGADKVKLMTVHSAKGLEFPTVFLCGMNEGIFPSRKVRTLAAMEEERRLAFVAITRAEDRLYLSEAEGINLNDSFRYPSRFLLDMGGAIHWNPAPEPSLIKNTEEYVAFQMDKMEGKRSGDFHTGDRVHHKFFGEGTIEETDPERGAWRIHFDKMGTDRWISFQTKLEKGE